MVEPRLKSKLTIAAWLRIADAAGKPGMVLKRGDPDAGAILMVLRGRAGTLVLSQTRNAAGDEAWIRLSGTDPIDQAATDALIARQIRFDSDIWAVEFESPDLKPPVPLRLIDRKS